MDKLGEPIGHWLTRLWA